MHLKRSFAVIGGDLRQRSLLRQLRGAGLPGFRVPRAGCGRQRAGLIRLLTGCERSDFAHACRRRCAAGGHSGRGGASALICGGMLDPAEALLQARGISFYDYAKDEALLLQNAELTAEAALALLLERLPGPLAGSRILLCGFGRIGKLLARKLKALGADVTVSARKAQALELARILGYRRVTAGSWADAPAQYDGIVNTVPAPIIGPAQLPCIRRDCVLLELASLPGGFCAEAQALPGYCAARGLPGKYAPEAAAAIIRSAIFRNLNLEEAT